MSTELTAQDLSDVFRGDQRATRSLVDALTPVIQARVARALLTDSRARSRQSIHQEVADLSQEVFISLFENDARVLKSWSPERGLSLKNFVGLVAHRQVLSILRTGKRNPFTEDPTLAEDFEHIMPPTPAAEEAIASRQVLQQVFSRLEERLSPLGQQLFEMIVIREHSVSQVEAATGMSSAAIYAWRSRLAKLVRHEATLVMSDGSVHQQIPLRGDR